MAAPNLETLVAAQFMEEVDRLKQSLALAERDRQLLSYEIHDGIVQDMSAAAMLLEAAGRDATFSSPEVAENFAGGLRLLRESIAEARRIISGLALVEYDASGLDAALDRLVGKFRSELSLPVIYRCEASFPRLPDSAQHLLLRIAQEALFNSWKHAKATRVEVGLKQVGEQLELSICDDGAGFDPKKIPAGHHGVRGMQSRASVLDADLQIQSAAGQGTRVIVRLKAPSRR
ncbi:MAG TPA: sensor histidine kinase [Pirellulaceae bacterium]|nr:sensor histidine kinase [Pirellulaceae bacterium]